MGLSVCAGWQSVHMGFFYYFFLVFFSSLGFLSLLGFFFLMLHLAIPVFTASTICCTDSFFRGWSFVSMWYTCACGAAELIHAGTGLVRPVCHLLKPFLLHSVHIIGINGSKGSGSNVHVCTCHCIYC